MSRTLAVSAKVIVEAGSFRFSLPLSHELRRQALVRIGCRDSQAGTGKSRRHTICPGSRTGNYSESRFIPGGCSLRRFGAAAECSGPGAARNVAC